MSSPAVGATTLAKFNVSMEQQPKWSETTRYLAAAAHSDPTFRKAVLDNIYHAQFRCKAPEFGIDERSILDECHRADRRWKIRDALLLTILIIFLISSDFYSDVVYVLSDHLELFGLLLQYHALGLILLVLSGATVLFCELLINEHFTLRRRFTKQAHPLSPSLDEHFTASQQNLVVYAGYSPFVGSGLSLRDWSFSVNLEKKLDDYSRGTVSEICIEELTKAIQSRLTNLGVHALEQYYVLFADGRHVRGDEQLMLSPYKLPPRHIPRELVPEYSRADQETSRRTYLCIEITDWSGEMVLTTYLRFKKGESHLFAEASSFILPPLKQSYYEIDSMDPSLKINRIAGFILGAIMTAPFRLAWSPFSVLRIISEPVHHWSVTRRIRKTIRDNPMFNYGAVTSIRQLGMENRFRVYFQRLDRDMHQKTIEQCLMDSIVDYLEDHDIDTSDIRERRTAILNSGVLVTGGMVTAENVTVGTGARSMVSKVQSMSSVKKG
jgi:hypothetical protein